MKKPAVVWTLDEALEFMRPLWNELAPKGWHLGITGGVLVNGSSTKDLDLIAYPRSSRRGDRRALRAHLRSQGWSLHRRAQRMRAGWRKSGSDDRKHVEMWRDAEGRRIDLFIMGETA